MTEHTQTENRLTNSIVDFVYGVTEDSHLRMDVVVRDDGKCAIFYNKPFKNDLSWLEFNMDTDRLDFIIDSGEARNFGLPIKKEIGRNIQNTHQMLMILVDDETGEAKEGMYVPIMVHRS